MRVGAGAELLEGQAFERAFVRGLQHILRSDTGVEGCSPPSLDLAARTRRAIGWLELAEAGPQPWQARIQLAHLLATTPVAELRDPARARSL